MFKNIFDQQIAEIIFMLVIFIFSVFFCTVMFFKFNFIHFFLIFEAISIAINLGFIGASVSSDNIEGDIIVLFNLAIAASETAVGLSFFVVSILNKPKTKKNSYVSYSYISKTTFSYYEILF